MQEDKNVMSKMQINYSPHTQQSVHYLHWTIRETLLIVVFNRLADEHV